MWFTLSDKSLLVLNSDNGAFFKKDINFVLKKRGQDVNKVWIRYIGDYDSVRSCLMYPANHTFQSFNIGEV
jgi:hypothetical protein